MSKIGYKSLHDKLKKTNENFMRLSEIMCNAYDTYTGAKVVNKGTR